MALALNTGHPLYGNLMCCIGVDGGALVDLVTARTFTVHAEASYGTGTYGEHFRTVNGGYTLKGATFSPALSDDTATTPNQTTLFVFNNILNRSNVAKFSSSAGGNYPSLGINVNGKGVAVNANMNGTNVTTTTILNTGAFMITMTRTGETAHEIYVNNTLEATGGNVAGNSSSVGNAIGGWNGQGALGGDFVWFVKFNKVLTSTEISDLYASLGANNQFALVTSGADTTAPTFSVAPATSNIQQTQADISATIDETGDIYWVVVPQGDTNPTVTEVLNGQASGGGVPVDSGSALAGTTLSDTAIGLTASTAYKFVLVAQDDEPTPNVQASVTVVNFSTIAANGILSTPSALKNNAGTIQSSVTNITARVYNQTTGALVVELTGLSSDGSGMLSFNDPLIIPATTYNVNLIVGTTTGLIINRAFFPATAT